MPAAKLPPAPTGDSQPFSAGVAPFYKPYLIFQQGVEPEGATPRQRFEALAMASRAKVTFLSHEVPHVS
jgi:hypothetical protein